MIIQQEISKKQIVREIEGLSLSMLQEVSIFLDSLKKKASVKYDFSDLAGKLKWQGDPIAEQRRLRDEW